MESNDMSVAGSEEKYDNGTIDRNIVNIHNSSNAFIVIIL